MACGLQHLLFHIRLFGCRVKILDSSHCEGLSVRRWAAGPEWSQDQRHHCQALRPPREEESVEPAAESLEVHAEKKWWNLGWFLLKSRFGRLPWAQVAYND